MNTATLSKTAQRKLSAQIRATMRLVDELAKRDEWTDAYEVITEAQENLTALADDLYSRMNEAPADDTKTVDDIDEPLELRTLDLFELLPKMWSKEESQGDMTRCAVCGRKTSPKEQGLGVVVVDGGGSIVHVDDIEVAMVHDGGYMGWFPVGSSCIKAVPEEFRSGDTLERYSEVIG